MPYAPEWETVNIDLGWMLSNEWQAGIPATPVLEAATAFRFNVTNEMFDTSLWIEDLKCVESVEGYTPATIPAPDIDAIKPFAASRSYKVNVQGRNISITGIAKDTRYAVGNMLGQVIASEHARGSLNMVVPGAGRYVLHIGGENRVITIK